MTTLANRHLIERMIGRAIPPGDPKITLTISALSSIIDAARAEERARSPKEDPFTRSFNSTLETLMRGARK